MEKFIFGNYVKAITDVKLHNITTYNLWRNFCANASEISLGIGEQNTFLIGEVEFPELLENDEYVIRVTKDGVAIKAHNSSGLMRGFTHLIRKIEFLCLEEGKETFAIENFSVNKVYELKKRMVHYCIFPETELEQIRREIRYAGLLHFTHVCLEFWGTFKYDCLKELSWPNAYTKKEVASLVREIREFGMEPIPFFNHLGHAALSKISNGKHVVLNQNPRLQNLFMGDGWEWNITSEKTKKLLKDVREEMVEVFGEGEYFHIGCDEAYMILNNKDLKPLMADYVRELTNQVEAEGRIPLLWADMYISKKEIYQIPAEDNGSQYWAPLKDENETNFQLASLSKNSILIDWQYEVTDMPFRSFKNLKDKGFKVMTAPWYRRDNGIAALETVNKYDGYGIMCTTWGNRMTEDENAYRCMLEVAKRFGAPQFEWSQYADWRAEIGTIFRKATFETLGFDKIGINNL